MGQAALNSAARVRRRDGRSSQEPAQSARPYRVRQVDRRGCELFERTTRRYGKPEWGIKSTVGGKRVPVHITPVWERPFCRLLHFERALAHPPTRAAAEAC